MMSLDLDAQIKVATKVRLVVKPSHVAIAKDFSGEVSYSNKLETTILSCENGQLLSSVKLKFFDSTLESIITLSSSKKMNLKVGDKVTALIKASELSIGEVL
jgi:molybdopterin-binding protein